MNKYQVAAGVVAVAEREKEFNVASKKRAGTKRASFKMSRDGIEHAIASRIDADRRPKIEPVQTIGVYGPSQGVRVWKRK